MEDHELSRRDFSKLTMAAFGGMLAGAGVAQAAEDKKTGKKSPFLYEPHICRGLNTCKGKDPQKDNACAGQGNCATVASHSCKGENACRGQGGCGEKIGESACKGMGGCEVPLADETKWKKARKRFEVVMAADGKKVGPAPPKGA
jgi:hypothetical protein